MHDNTTILTQTIRKRPPISHKGTYGRIVLIGGAAQYGGAIMMAAEAAVRSGAGLTTVICDSAVHTALHSRLPEAMCLAFSSKEIEAVCQAADVLVIGPGLGLSDQSRALLFQVLHQQLPDQWLVIDGSAITLFSEGGLFLRYPEHTVFTPHQMEWQRLSSIALTEQTPTKNQAAAKHLGAYVVVKSHRSALYFDTQYFRNAYGSPAMATGGMGDTLAGIIGGFLAQFPRTFTTVAAAIVIHSYIGEELAKTRYVVLPTELSRQLPFYMKKFEQKEETHL